MHVVCRCTITVVQCSKCILLAERYFILFLLLLLNPFLTGRKLVRTPDVRWPIADTAPYIPFRILYRIVRTVLAYTYSMQSRLAPSKPSRFYFLAKVVS